MKGEEMAYTPMTAEQFVVAELQDAKDKIYMLKQQIDNLKSDLEFANDTLDLLCSKLELRHSEYSGNYISFDLFPTEDNDPELYAKLKWRIEDKGAV